MKALEYKNKINRLASLEIIVEDSTMTVVEFFKLLLLTLWDEGEQFNGKRPLGDSGWEYTLYKPMIKAGIVEGVLDEYDDIEDFNQDEANQLIRQLISSLKVAL